MPLQSADILLYLPILLGAACLVFGAAVSWLMFSVTRLESMVQQLGGAVRRLWTYVRDR